MRLNKENSGKRWYTRPDGKEKVTGTLQYLTDKSLPGMLYGRVLRSIHPYARIISVDTAAAEGLPGVQAVLTHKDVPGMNAFGIATPDQPVFCDEFVRYTGDAVAAVAADTLEIAEAALKLIKVEYEVLSPLSSPEAALAPDAPKLHPHGNILHRTEVKRGNAEAAWIETEHIIRETYYTPRQMHTYMETEGGLFVPEENGRLSVYAPTQHGYKDRMQLSRILNMEEEMIRVVSSPIGGSFGGKDELNVQPYGALLALRTKRPVKIHNSRKESVRAGLKRHPMKIEMETGFTKEGMITAHRVRITADTGAYATLGAPVLNFATEHSMGPYSIPHVDVEGLSVYTNNGVSGEFRGFGGNQAIFAMEGQMDRAAAQLGIDPWELRRRNLRSNGDPGPLGQQILVTNGLQEVWEAVHHSDLWIQEERTELPPWIRKGKGAAIAMHGAGLGYGIPDPAGGRLRLNEEGKIEAAFSYEEFGQGLVSTLEIMLCELFNCVREDLEIVIGDTDRVPHSGSSTASRSTTMAWMALQRLKTPFRDKITLLASQATGIPAHELVTGPGGIWRRSQESREDQYRVLSFQAITQLASAEELTFDTKFDYPTTPDEVVGGHYLYTYAAVMAEVEVNTLSGQVKVDDIRHVVAAGPVMNPMGYVGQIEGGSGMALGFTLMEDSLMENSEYMTTNLDTYLIPTIQDMQKRLDVEAIEHLPENDPFGPRGIGEIGSVALAPAIVSAIYQATGVWLNKLPVQREQLIKPVFSDKKEGVQPS
ncbi:xanthine dehydrogenase subunit D [Paenibacillus urinalis]|uniref:Xanthine dehydrogenase subunit D n=1 Tax=Paenibacillus urinalis TaxID=521520 RepID=A0AAX3MVZ5_9BACL|nr:MULTISPECIES: xanthine dehydrogenase subunit D [Paenibacillus]WDH81004.1 xanthine dehydrogenase subunit D [Paenibacillus urinalis]WDH97056.1 xanthine dehydrogenase subunit D [Paenibacillus urinalis]WDI00718.1 xanthine dehydrogenase subunit D [Paenibacillus urinalis]GAK39390.1 xanthine dehydrogenase [Paenibacillus sp. TCA20]